MLPAFRTHLRYAALLTALAIAVAALDAAPAQKPVAQPGFGHRSAGLPLAAQGPISAALGGHDRSYRVVGLWARNPAQHLAASFSPAGATIASGPARVRLGLVAYGRARALRPLAAVAPRAAANRVDYDHGSMREWWANGPLGLEQGFDVRSRPAGGPGPLMLSLAVAGDLRVRLARSGVVLKGNGRELRYGGLTATDAQGRTLPSTLGSRAGRIEIDVNDHNALYPIRIDPFLQQAELTSSDGRANDLLGAAVAISGDTIVASTLALGRKPDLSGVYVFVKPASGWANATQTAKLTTPDSETSSIDTVAISGDTIVAGGPDHTVGTTAGQGAAFVFVKPASGWKNARETATLTASDGGENDGLGNSVAVAGDTVVAGAPGHTVGTRLGQGAAYVFVKPAAGWRDGTQTAELTASDGAAGDDLSSVSISGDTIVAGAASHTVGTHQSQGAAYVFVKPAAGWNDTTQTAELTASDGAAGDDLGAATATAGDTIVAGATQAQVGNNKQQGAAYVFVKPASGWIDAAQAGKLTASDGRADDEFGLTVGASGGRVIAGTRRIGSQTDPSPGVAYLFAKPSSGWGDTTQTEELVNPTHAATVDLFGFAVAISGNLGVAGAPFEAIGGNESQGAVHVFQPPPTITLGNPVDGATFTQGQAVAASYSCTPPNGATITACTGPVPRGAPIDTNSLGPHTFTVSTLDSDGVSITRSVDYGVVARASAGPTATPPSITAVRQSAAVWRRGGKLVRVATTAKRPVGTTFSFTLDQSASVTLSFTRRIAGRTAHGRCAKPTARNRSARCTLSVAAGTLILTGRAGPNRIHFEGRISRTIKLRPGRYAVAITATNSAGQSATASALRFRIVR